MMTTPHERTKAVIDTRELLQMLASAEQITIDGLVQSVALSLLRHYPLDIDLDVSAAALPGVWAAPEHRRTRKTAASEFQGAPNRTNAYGVRNERERDGRQHVVPDDFPRVQALGVVPGTQPKLLVREMDGRHHAGLTGEELWVRYDACKDLASQLAEYASRKMSTSGLSLDEALRRVEKGLEAKVNTGQWDLSRGEIAWVIAHTSELLSEGNAGGDGYESC
ncbi:hypothetical protein P0D69_42735 [Paraburkholderia sediminicola]|uniref:BPSL0761 family protein n=1 Tax=Paraburkholderia sediminicola TaxID=458836 RepID=UPI0038B9149B